MNAPMTLPPRPDMRAHGPFAVHPNVAARQEDDIAAAMHAHRRRERVRQQPEQNTPRKTQEQAVAAMQADREAYAEAVRLRQHAQYLAALGDAWLRTSEVAAAVGASHKRATQVLAAMAARGTISRHVEYAMTPTGKCRPITLWGPAGSEAPEAVLSPTQRALMGVLADGSWRSTPALAGAAAVSHDAARAALRRLGVRGLVDYRRERHGRSVVVFWRAAE